LGGERQSHWGREDYAKFPYKSEAEEVSNEGIPGGEKGSLDDGKELILAVESSRLWTRGKHDPGRWGKKVIGKELPGSSGLI